MLFRMLRNFDRVFTLAYYVSGLAPHEIGTLITFARVPGYRLRAGLRGLHTACPSVKWDGAFALLIFCIARVC